MGPKVKKQVKNAFSFYLEDYVETQRELGRNVSMKIAAEECGPLWQALPEEEKQRYGQIAAAYKVYSKEDKHNKFTSTGVSYAELERQEEELRKKNESADAEIKMTISNLDAELCRYDLYYPSYVWAKQSRLGYYATYLKTHLFYIVHCNYYCKTNKGVYVPGEIAISEFSLGDGVRRTFHRLINPGPIPFGYAYEATETIKEIHGLPYPPYEEGDSDYVGLRDLILRFLEPGKLHDGKYPPLYTIENNLKASEYILGALVDTNPEEDDCFRVYLLHKMFFWLKNKCVEHIDDENVGFPVMSNAESELIRDVFRYAPGISCSFHLSSEDKYHNCSLSFVQRFSYVICDHCCQHIGVDLIPGKHCRPNADVEGGRLCGFSVKSRSPPPMSEAGDSEYDERSSYAGNFSSFNWKRENPGSFLHEELESKFSAFEMSSAVSRSSYNPSTSHPDRRAPRSGTSLERGEAEEESCDEENFQRVFSLGRGISRR